MAKQWGVPSLRYRIFECSGTPAGQSLAYGLLARAATLLFVGYTFDKVTVRLSNLMAFDATAHGTWGCPPSAYREVLAMIYDGPRRARPLRRLRADGHPATEPRRHGGSQARKAHGARSHPRHVMTELKNHELVPRFEFRHIQYETKPVLDRDGNEVEGLHQVWIALDNQAQLNSYTTDAVKEVILAFQRASNDRSAVAVVFTATGDRAFCTGGNTEEYATYYANRPLEYLQYMRLFNDMVTYILLCDKPVICRVNGMRIAGGQEIGMACDFTVSGDHARFGQAGPVHGSAPDGGSTDFLDWYVGYAKAAESLALCDSWSAHKALRLGLINDIAPVYKKDGEFIANPFVITDQTDAYGRIVYGDYKTGDAKQAAKALVKECEVDLSELDKLTNSYVTKLLYTFPDCTRKTLTSQRKKKLNYWQANSETNRSWLSLNMNTEAAAGFPAFQFGQRGAREIDFVALRKRVAEGAVFDADLVREVLPEAARATFDERLAKEKGS